MGFVLTRLNVGIMSVEIFSNWSVGWSVGRSIDFANKHSHGGHQLTAMFSVVI